MFRNTIAETPLTNAVANGYFKNISGSAYMGDTTFLATLRALLAPRIGEDESVNLIFTNNSASEGQLKDDSLTPGSKKTLLKRLVGVTDVYYGNIVVNNFRGTAEASDAWHEFLADRFASAYPGFKKIDKVSLFFKKSFAVSCFINTETKGVVLCVSNMDIRIMHYLQVGIFAFLPWFFDPKAGVSPLEMELINSLREKTEDKYREVIEKFAEQYDFRTMQIKSMLKGFEQRHERARMDQVKNEIQNCINRINNLNSQIATYLESMHSNEVVLLGLETKIASESEDSEIMEYFLANKKLDLVSVSDSSMRFIVKDKLAYYDEDLIKKVLANKSSFLYRSGGRISDDDMELLISSVFLDEKIRIRVCAAYEFSLTGNVSAIAGYPFGPEYNGYMPNPHIQNYRCMGNHVKVINEMLMKHDYIPAVEQCVASAKSLNFGDSIVMGHFVSTISSGYSKDNARYFELPDGKCVTAKEAVEYLKKEEA